MRCKNLSGRRDGEVKKEGKKRGRTNGTDEKSSVTHDDSSSSDSDIRRDDMKQKESRQRTEQHEQELHRQISSVCDRDFDSPLPRTTSFILELQYDAFHHLSSSSLGSLPSALTSSQSVCQFPVPNCIQPITSDLQLHTQRRNIRTGGRRERRGGKDRYLRIRMIRLAQRLFKLVPSPHIRVDVLTMF